MNHKFCHFIYLIVFLLARQIQSKGGLNSLPKNLKEYRLHADLEPLVTSVILKTNSLKCLAIICDNVYQDVFGSYFFNGISGATFFKILVETSEDLMSPNYKTLSTIRKIRRNSCQTYIILLANGEQLKRFLLFGDRHRELDARSNFILLYDDRLFKPDLNYLWKKFVNVIFLRKYMKGSDTNNWYELSTVPFPAPIEEALVPRKLDTWRRGHFYSNAELFRDKTSNLRHQTFRVITFQHVPSAFKMPGPVLSEGITLEGTEPIGYAGLEIEMLKALSNVMNFEAQVYDVSLNEKWGRKQPDGSFSGLLGEVVSGRADIALGNLYYTPYYLDLMDLTIPYNTQCLTFLTPESLTDNSWKTLLLPFGGYLWLGVFLSVLTGGMVFLALAKFYRHVDGESSKKVHKNRFGQTDRIGLYQFDHPVNSFLYTYSMLLLVSIPKLPEGWSLRIFTGWWWMYCILLVVAYRASMTSILAMPNPKITIDTLEQLVESQIGVGGWGEEIKQFFQTSLDAAGKKIGSKFEIVYDVDKAIEMVAEGRFAYYENIFFLRHASLHRQLLVLEESDQARKYGRNITSVTTDRSLHIMRDCIINMPISLGLQKNSPLKPKIDKFLQMIIEAGLVKKWLYDAMAQVIAADANNDKQPIKALMNLRKLYGAFVTLGIGYGLSALLLISEKLFWHVTVVKHPLYDKYSNTILNVQTINGQI